MCVRASIEPLDWDSKFFALSTAKLVVPDNQSDTLLNALNLSDYQLIQAKIAADDYVSLSALHMHGFQLVEGEIDLVVSDVGANVVDTVSLHFAVAADIPALRTLAGKSFLLSRFRAPWFNAEKCAEFYRVWVENAVLSKFDDCCLVMKDAEGVIQGFVTLRQLNHTDARIGLLAVNPAYQGQGIGQQLMQHAFVWCQQHLLTRLYVGTQSSNLAALRLYIKSGATVANSAYWLYRLNH